MENNNWIIKYSVPNKLVKAPFASIIKKINDTTGEIINYDLYIQISSDEENPEWLEVGKFLLLALEDKLHNPDYLNEMLRLFNEYKNK